MLQLCGAPLCASSQNVLLPRVLREHPPSEWMSDMSVSRQPFPSAIVELERRRL